MLVLLSWFINYQLTNSTKTASRHYSIIKYRAIGVC